MKKIRSSARASRLAAVVASAATLACAPGALADEVTVEVPAVADTSIYEDLANSNGAGNELFIGRTGSLGGFTYMRSLVRFDLEGLVPDGATIVEARLQLFLTQASGSSVPTDHFVRRVEASWGEAGSSASGGTGAPAQEGDATWFSRFHPDTAWTTNGGDLAATDSAVLEIANAPGTKVFSGAGLGDDVQGWLDDPSTNHGWMILVESEAVFNGRKFGARENGIAERRPLLVVTYEEGGKADCPGDVDGGGAVDFDDLLTVIANWGPCAGCPQDLDGDDLVGFGDLLVVLANWGPCP